MCESFDRNKVDGRLSHTTSFVQPLVRLRVSQIPAIFALPFVVGGFLAVFVVHALVCFYVLAK